MAEDQVETTPLAQKKPSASEKLFKARERLRVEVEQREEAPPRTAKRETGEPFRVDWEKGDRADELLLSEAEELHAQLLQRPDRKDAEIIQRQIDTLSEGVGREKKAPGDMEARLYGLGFVLQRNSEKLPGSIRTLVERMERPRNYADYMEARRALEPAIVQLGADVGDQKAREVRNLLERRRDIKRLVDHFDYLQSGRQSLQERFMNAIGRNAPEQTLRRMIANGVEDAWRWLGFTELRPTTMFSQARLRMERGDADPMILMAMKVGEEREALEKEVAERVETQQEAAGEAAAEETEAEVEEQEAEGEEEPPAEWEEQLAQEEREKVRRAAEELDRLDFHELIERLEDLLNRLKSNDEVTRRRALIELGMSGLIPKTESISASQAPVEPQLEARGRVRRSEDEGVSKQAPETQTRKEVPDWKSFLESPTAREFLRRAGKTQEELETSLDGLAKGTIGLQEFAESFIPKAKGEGRGPSKVRKVFYQKLEQELRQRGYIREESGEIKPRDLQMAMKSAAERAMDKEWSDNQKKIFRNWFLITVFFNTLEEMKAAAAKGFKES